MLKDTDFVVTPTYNATPENKREIREFKENPESELNFSISVISSEVSLNPHLSNVQS